MAKQALCEALSLDKKPIHQYLPDTKPSISHQPVQTFTNTLQNQLGSSYYASSTENIAKLLENWMKKSPKSSAETNSYMVTTAGSSSSEGAQSAAATPDALDSLLSFNSDGCSIDENGNTAAEGGLFQDESKPNMEAGEVPLTLLEKWLFDDGGITGPDGHEADLINMSLGDESTQGLF